MSAYSCRQLVPTECCMTCSLLMQALYYLSRWGDLAGSNSVNQSCRSMSPTPGFVNHVKVDQAQYARPDTPACWRSFWGQFGPNATTFLLASELFPTDTRGKAHGISAAVGKLGALAADIILGKVSPIPLRIFACLGFCCF